jgi:hypothetical protein
MSARRWRLSKLRRSTGQLYARPSTTGHAARTPGLDGSDGACTNRGVGSEGVQEPSIQQPKPDVVRGSQPPIGDRNPGTSRPCEWSFRATDRDARAGCRGQALGGRVQQSVPPETSWLLRTQRAVAVSLQACRTLRRPGRRERSSAPSRAAASDATCSSGARPATGTQDIGSSPAAPSRPARRDGSTLRSLGFGSTSDAAGAERSRVGADLLERPREGLHVGVGQVLGEVSFDSVSVAAAGAF